jgi:hypothetical protein
MSDRGNASILAMGPPRLSPPHECHGAPVTPARAAPALLDGSYVAPTELLSDDAALRSRTHDEIQGFGVHWLRVVLYWHSVAPVPDDPGVPRFDGTGPNANPASDATTGSSARRGPATCGS